MPTKELTFPRGPWVTYLRIAGIAVLALGLATTVFGMQFGAQGHRWLFVGLGMLDFAVGGAMLSYHRNVRIDVRNHVVTCKTWVFFPIRRTTYIPGAFERIALRSAGRDRRSIYLEGNRSLFIDGPVDERIAQAWAQEISSATGWKIGEGSAASSAT